MLTGNEIRIQREAGRIEIEDFDEKRLGPNSYNLRLADELVVYDEIVLDPKQENRYKRFRIPEDGLVLEPGMLYLARTMERTHTDYYAPLIEGRSSVGRLGVQVHVTAGFGDIGFNGRWTLEIVCAHRVRLYPGMEICQLAFFEPCGEIMSLYNGKYQNATGVDVSRMRLDWSRGID